MRRRQNGRPPQMGEGGELQRATGPEPVDEAADDGIVRELEHDDFDPVGTLVLVLIYMAILIGMWVFMYFVEFLGRGLTVVG